MSIYRFPASRTLSPVTVAVPFNTPARTCFQWITPYPQSRYDLGDGYHMFCSHAGVPNHSLPGLDLYGDVYVARVDPDTDTIMYTDPATAWTIMADVARAYRAGREFAPVCNQWE